MGRALLSAIVGYVVIFVAVFGLMTAGWFAVGSEGAFQPGSWEVTGTWLVISVVVSLVAGVLGGYVSAVITPDRRGTKWLAGLVLVLGVVFALPVLLGMGQPPSEARPDHLPMFEAMQKGQPPAWLTILNPILGVLGVWAGARLR